MESYRMIGAKARGGRTLGCWKLQNMAHVVAHEAIIVLKVKLHVIKITVFCLRDWKGKTQMDA